MKKWLVAILIGIGLAALAASTRWWLPLLQTFLAFVGANSDLIQGLTDAIQLILWPAAAIMALIGWFLRPRSQAQSSQPTASQVAVEGDVQGDVIVVADPEQLWRLIRNKPPSTDLSQATGRYLKYLVDRYRYLDFKGMGVSDRVPLRLPLVEMYIPLKARIEMPQGETWARDLRLAGRTVSQAEAEAMG